MLLCLLYIIDNDATGPVQNEGMESLHKYLKDKFIFQGTNRFNQIGLILK